MRESAKYGKLAGLLTVFLAALCVSCLLSLRYLQSEVMHREFAFIGFVEEEHPEWTGELLSLLYRSGENTNGKTAEMAEKAFLRCGYTAEGPSIFRGRFFPERELFICAAVFLLLLAGALVLIRLIGLEHSRQLRMEEKKAARLWESLGEMEYLRVKNRRLKNFIENVTHQIKTPLSRMISSLETGGENCREECIAHGEQISGLIRRLLVIGRMEAGETFFVSEPFYLADLFDDLTGELTQAYNPGVEVRIRPADSRAFWYGDYNWTREALNNLFVNAAEHDASGLPLELACEAEKDWYRITLRDHGTGFHEEDSPALFDRFYTPKEMKKGHVGLGLNLSRLIIEGQKGSIHAENCPGGGARFTILLPRHATMK